MKRMHKWDIVVAGCGLVALVLFAGAVVATARGKLELGFDTFVGSVAAAAIGVALLMMKGAPAVGLTVEGGELTLRFGGWDRLWTLRKVVRVPVTTVRSVSISRLNDVAPEKYQRMHRGTALPGLIRAGSANTSGGAELWDVRADAGDVLCIDLTDPAPYRRIVLQVPDPKDTRDSLGLTS